MRVDRRSFVVGAGAALLPIGAARAAEAKVFRVPITLTDSRVLVDCTLSGHGPYPFVFDTGGTIGLLDLKLAKALKLRSTGTSQLGLRQRSGRYPIYIVPEIAFGAGMGQRDAAFAGIEDFHFGPGVMGSLAAGVLTAGQAELDFGAREWRVYRDTVPDRTGWTRYDKAIVHRGNLQGSAFLFADAMLGGRSFRFGLDTGMPGGMHLYRKTAEAAGLWNAARWTPAAPDGRNRMVRLPALGLAGSSLEGVIATLIEDPEWQYFDAGVVGLPVLRRFDMATDARDAALYLKPNGLPAQQERYNRAGIWIERAGPDVKVSVVGPGSPAALAGIKPGDRLIGADFRSLVERMQDPAGTAIPLTVQQGGTRRDIGLTLADFL